MKTFARFRTPKEIKRACQRVGFTFSDDLYQKGSDSVSFTFKHGRTTLFVVYNTFNGRALFTMGKSRDVHSTDSTAFENRPWFQALLEFIYVS